MENGGEEQVSIIKDAIAPHNRSTASPGFVVSFFRAGNNEVKRG